MIKKYLKKLVSEAISEKQEQMKRELKIEIKRELRDLFEFDEWFTEARQRSVGERMGPILQESIMNGKHFIRAIVEMINSLQLKKGE